MSQANLLAQHPERQNVAATVSFNERGLKELHQRAVDLSPLPPPVKHQESSSATEIPGSSRRLVTSSPAQDTTPMNQDIDSNQILVSPKATESMRQIEWLSLLFSVAIASYAVSHHHDLFPEPAQEPAEEFQIFSQDKLSLSYRRQNLSCLNDFIGGPVWIVGPPLDSPSDNFHLSITVSEFAKLWGPVWGIEVNDHPRLVTLFTERGEIMQAESSETSMTIYAAEDEILCHWRRLTHREHLNRRREIEQAIQLGTPMNAFTANSLLLIGLPSSPSSGLNANLNCCKDSSQFIEQESFNLTVSGTHDQTWQPSTRSVTVTGGRFVTLGGTQTYTAVPASTLKDRIFSLIQGARGIYTVLSVLRLHVGLEMSVCTGNAARISLWETLKLCCVPQEKW